MTTVANYAGDVSIQGSLRLGGSLSPALSKANVLALAELQAFPIPLTDFRVWDAMQTVLPGTPLADDLGLVGGTFATATPSIRTEDLKNLGATSSYARFLVQLPWEYVAGQSVTLRFSAGMITTIASATATLDVQAFKVLNAPATALEADLYAGAAVSINSLVFANTDFALTSSGLSPGDILDVRITTAVSDTGTGTAVIAGLASARLLCDVR